MTTKSASSAGYIMNAHEARTHRRASGRKTLEERLRHNPDRARRIDEHLAELRLEQQFIDAMEHLNMTAAQLARRVKRQPAAISRDLAGGLSAAKLGRVRELAAAVDCDVLTLLIPHDPEERKKVVEYVRTALSMVPRGIALL
jgi:hypothetical protein